MRIEKIKLRRESDELAPALPAENLRMAPIHARPGKKRVLVMDDDATIRNVLTVMLHSLGYSTYAAESGEEAVACYRIGRALGFPFSAALLDLTMLNGMGGTETVRRLAAMDRDVRAVIMSGNVMHEAITDFARHGFHRALLKPFTIEELEAVLSSLFEEGRVATR